MKFAIMAILSVVTAADAAGGAQKMTLLSPLDYQVFQRESKTRGTILVAGKAIAGVSVEVRLNDQPWKSAPVDPRSRQFRLQLPAEAGGWYRVEVRGGEESRAVEHVGVGEVFLVAGQSNSANHGSAKQKTTSGKVSSFDGAKWQLANDPQPGASGHGGSFMPAFGDALVEKCGVPVAVVPCGIGATSVRQWLPKGARMNKPPTTGGCKMVQPSVWESSGGPFDALMKRVAQFGPQGFRAVLWHQGESDCNQAPACEITPDQYRQFMAQLIAATRKQAQWDIPWFVAQVSYHSEKDPSHEGLRAAQAALWKEGVAREGPDTDALRREFRAGVHFNGKGLQAHGKLWAEKVAAYLDDVVKP